jgi:polyisoprenoid-binding protein YceI
MSNQTKWSIDQAHSEVAFKVRHLMIAHVKGTFKTFDASIYTIGNDFTTAEIDFWIDPATISTGDAKRDEHIMGPDFFDVVNHKQITFTSNSLGKPDADGNHELWGDLTIKGVLRNIKLDVQFGGIVKDPWGNTKAGFTVTGKINRNDWGLTWNTALDAGGLMLSEEVGISCEVELIDIGHTDLVMELAHTPEVKGIF